MTEEKKENSEPGCILTEDRSIIAILYTPNIASIVVIRVFGCISSHFLDYRSTVSNLVGTRHNRVWILIATYNL